jgi:ribosomal protein S13
MMQQAPGAVATAAAAAAIATAATVQEQRPPMPSLLRNNNNNAVVSTIDGFGRSRRNSVLRNAIYAAHASLHKLEQEQLQTILAKTQELQTALSAHQLLQSAQSQLRELLSKTEPQDNKSSVPADAVDQVLETIRQVYSSAATAAPMTTATTATTTTTTIGTSYSTVPTQQDQHQRHIFSAKAKQPIQLCQKARGNESESWVLVTRQVRIPFSRLKPWTEQLVRLASARRMSRPATGMNVSGLHPRCQWAVSDRIKTHNFQIRYWFPSIEFDCSGSYLRSVVCACQCPQIHRNI